MPSGTPKLVMLSLIPNFLSHVLTQAPKEATEEAVVIAMTDAGIAFLIIDMTFDSVRNAAIKTINKEIIITQAMNTKKGFHAERTTSRVSDQIICIRTIKIK